MGKPPYDPEALPPDLRKLVPDYSLMRTTTDQENVVTPKSETKPFKQKSCAQVATSVRPPVVRPKSGGLKPGRIRPYRLMGRYSKEERKKVIARAEAMCMSVNEYIRTTTLGENYASPLNPELRQRLKALNRELAQQGCNLGRISEHIGVNSLSPEAANSMLGIIARSLLAAHMRVCRELKAGQTEQQ